MTHALPPSPLAPPPLSFPAPADVRTRATFLLKKNSAMRIVSSAELGCARDSCVAPSPLLPAHTDVRTRATFLLKKNSAMRIVSNFLPPAVLHALQERDSKDVVAWDFDTVFVLQSDLVGFTALGSRVTPLQLCTFLHDLFSRFDDLATRLGVSKIETVGCALRLLQSPKSAESARESSKSESACLKPIT